MNKLVRDFKKYGLKGLALTLAFVAGMATSKPAKAMSYSSATESIRYEQSIDDFGTTKNTVKFENNVLNSGKAAEVTFFNSNLTTDVKCDASGCYYVPTTPIVEASNKKPIKMFYTDEELLAQGKDPERSCGDNYVYVTPLETKSITTTTATDKVVKADIKKQELSKKNTDKTTSTVGTTQDGKTYSNGGSTTTSLNGVTTMVNDNNTATIYQNVNGQLMKRDISTEGSKNYPRESGKFTAEGEVNLGWWGISTDNLEVDGVFQNSEGSTVIVTNNGQTVTTIDHSTGGVSTSQCSQATAKSLLARASYYGQTYYEYTSAKGHYDVGTNLAETCMNGQCGIREVAVINNQVQLMNGETICNSNCYTL